MELEENIKYSIAIKRVKKIKGFYTHLGVYCTIIPIIIFVNLTFEPHFHWFWFSTLGWGIGLTCHWFTVFGFKLLGIHNNWEERKIKELMEKDNKK